LPSNSNSNNNNNNRLVVPQAQPAMDQFKYEIASELGIPLRATGASRVADQGNYQQALNSYKWEVAQELGIADQVRSRGWENMTSRECGRVGGRMGGKIGGQMVRRMIQLAEQQLANQNPQQ
jgi:hypothetical protein